MSNIDWDEEVQVLERLSFERDQSIGRSHVLWDRMSLSEAVERCLGLPPDDLAKVTILAPSGYYEAKEIETLFERRDFPHSFEVN